MAWLAVGSLRRRPDPRSGLNWAMALGTAALFFASPHYPWYFVSLVALLTAAPWWPAWWLTLAAVLLYWDPKTGNIPSWVGSLCTAALSYSAPPISSGELFPTKGPEHGVPLTAQPRPDPRRYFEAVGDARG